jgi:hypothetical protein
MRELLDGIEKAKPQIFLAHMRQKVANQEIVLRSNRTDKYPPAIPENEMSLPLGQIEQLTSPHQAGFATYFTKLRYEASASTSSGPRWVATIGIGDPGVE